MTPSDILTRLRGAINDAAGTRWTDATLRGWMFDGEMEIVGAHPEAQYDTSVVNSTPTLLAANTDSFTIDSSWGPALIDYVAFRVFMEDAEDTHNMALAMKHNDRFNAAMR